MVETELPDGEVDRNEAWGGTRSAGSGVMILLAGRGGVGRPMYGDLFLRLGLAAGLAPGLDTGLGFTPDRRDRRGLGVVLHCSSWLMMIFTSS